MSLSPYPEKGSTDAKTLYVSEKLQQFDGEFASLNNRYVGKSLHLLYRERSIITVLLYTAGTSVTYMGSGFTPILLAELSPI